METIIIEWFKRLPDWAFTASTIIFLGILIVIAYFISVGTKRYADAAGKENRLVGLQDEHRDLIIQKNKYVSEATQLQTVLMNSRSFINSLNELSNTDNPSHTFLIQRIVEGLASDIKSQGGDRHRCGFWIAENGVLTLTSGSAGFPESYIGNRELDINNSIAGRCFRKKQSINIPDVTIDNDWSSVDSSNSYKALICIPVMSWGVITIDAKEPMGENALLIGELYSTIIEGIFNDFMNRLETTAIQQTAAEFRIKKRE